jgi:hypothetical protein
MNNRQKDPSFDLQPSKAKTKKKKYVTLKVLTTLHQQDLNQLIEHLRQLQDFHFMVKSNILYPLEIKKEKDKDKDQNDTSSSLLYNNRVIAVLSIT